jgi:hypothetical protein
MALRVDDVPRLQAVLDIVDARVKTGAPLPSFQPVLTRAATLTVFVVSLNAGQLAVAMLLAMTLARPDAPLVAAAGIAAMAGAVVTWRDPTAMYGAIPDGFDAMFAAVLLVGGALLVGLAYARRDDEVPPRVWKLVGVVAVAMLASWLVPIIGSGIDAVGLHQAAREWRSAIVLPLALAGAMMWSARKSLRMASAVAAVVASATAAAVGSQTFLDRFGGDLFLVPTTDVKIRTLDRPVKEFTVPFSVSSIHLSPAGRSIAVLTFSRGNRHTIHIGRVAERLTPVDVDGALFIDDDRLLVWTFDGSRTDLREVLVSAPDAARWQLRVTGLPMPAVSLDAKSQRWRLASRAGADAVEAREGVIGTEQISSYRWPVPEGHGAPFMPIALSGDRALALEPRPDLAVPIGDPLGAFMFVLASGARWRSTIWSLGPDGVSDLGTSRLELECHVLPIADRGACQIFDASRTRFFTMDAATRGITAVASLPGRFLVGEEPQGNWITGRYQSSLVAVRLAPADAIRIVGPNGAHAHMLAVSDRMAAGVWYQMQTPASSGIRVEPISQATGTSVIRVYPID